jgi:hypothetical protein
MGVLEGVRESLNAAESIHCFLFQSEAPETSFLSWLLRPLPTKLRHFSRLIALLTL